MYILSFTRVPTGPNDPIQKPVTLYVKNADTAIFKKDEAIRFSTKQDAMNYAINNQDRLFFPFTPEEIQVDSAFELLRTISKAAYSGKWIEFWFQDEIRQEGDESFHFSSKIYEFNEAVEKAKLESRVLNKGVSGLTLVFTWDGHNYNIKEVLDLE